MQTRAALSINWFIADIIFDLRIVMIGHVVS
jgi:hypothetical protein